MNSNYYFKILFILLTYTGTTCSAQQQVQYNLVEALKGKKLSFGPNQSVTPVAKDKQMGLSVNGKVWIRDLEFSTGTIEVDLRGKDVFQKSFLGIALGPDSSAYEAVYFRPFNFQSVDSLRRKHTVQYISEPAFPWYRLREEHPMVYENATNPVPLASDWFHARIVIKAEEILVYVNHSSEVSLSVKRLNTIKKGVIGLWTTGLKGDFANLVITKKEIK